MKTRIRALRYGESGSGKTAMIRTWPLDIEAGEWMAIFDFDGGLNTIKNPVTGELPPGMFGLTFRDTERLAQTDERKFQRKAEGFKNARIALGELSMGEGVNEFIPEELRKEQNWSAMPKVVVIDTLSGLHDVAMNQALTLDPKTGLAGAPAMHHWGAQMRLVEEFVRMCEAHEWHLDVTAHVQAWKDDLIGTIRGSILVTGQKTPGLIPGWFDEVYYHAVRSTDKGISYILCTKNDGFFVAKSRLGILVKEIDVSLPEDVLLGREAANAGEYGWGRVFQILAEQYGTST